LILPAALAALAIAPSRGAAQQWTGTAGDGNWNTPGNWSTDTVPGTVAGYDNAYINTTGTTGITVNYNYTGSAVTLDQLWVALNNGTGGATDTLSMSANNLTANTEDIGWATSGNGTLTQGGGVNTVNTTLSIGDNFGDTGTYNLNGGTLISDGREYIGYDGTGTMNQRNGNSSIATNFDLFIGGNASSSTGFYNLSGGNLTVTGPGGVGGYGDELVGFIGNGTFTQTGGVNDLDNTADLILGQSTGITGTYELSAGTLNVGGVLYVGGGATNVGPGGTGKFTLSGTGSLSVGGAVVLYNTTNTVFNLNGGSVSAAAYNFNGNPAQLKWTAGSLEITTAVTFDSAAAGTTTSDMFGSSLTLGANQDLEIQGNETLGGTGAFALTLNSGSNNGVAGNLYLPSNGTITQNAGVLSYDRMYQQGGTVNGDLTNLGTFDYQSGTFNGRLINQNAVDFESSFTAGNGIENDATLALPAGVTVTANGQGLNNTTTGVITSTPTSILQIGGNLFNTSYQNTAFDLSTATVKFIGDTNHRVTWPGADMGATYAGYTNNFAIGTLELSSGDTLTLDGDGAIYVRTLLLDGFASSGDSLSTFIADNISNLDPDNLINIYYDPSQTGNAYLADQTYDLAGGGVLEPVSSVPEPASIALLGITSFLFYRRPRAAWAAFTQERP